MASTTLLSRAVRDHSRDVAPLRRVHATAAYQYRIALSPVGGGVKRGFDFAAAALGLIVLSPLLLAVAALVRLETPGPTLYRQRRTGFRGRAFTIFKFRTMHRMEATGDIRQARPGDSRVTPIGAVLRATSIDELPQLINVLRGEMSLVGPRPHALCHDHDFFGVDSEYPRRFLARPGITGAAQVNGARGVTDTPEKVEQRLQLDLDYVERWSLLRDVQILLCTVLLVFGDKNAC